jgi:hypothetical protein
MEQFSLPYDVSGTCNIGISNLIFNSFWGRG